MASGKTPAAGKLGLKRFYERTESIEPFYTGGPIALARSGAIVACGCGGNVKIVDVQTGAVLQNIEADGEQVTAIALSPNEQELVTSGRDFLVKTWDVASGAHARMWKSGQGTSYVQRLCYDETGTLVAGGCSDFVVRVWDAGRGYATHNLKGHGSIVTSVCFGATPRTDPNKLLLFSGTDEGEVRVWALATKTCKAVLKGHDSAVTALAIDVPTRTLLTAGRDRVVGVWDLKTMKQALSIPIFDTIEGIALVPPVASDGETPETTTAKDLEFVTAGEKGALKRWKVGTGKCLATEDSRHGAAYENLLATQGATTLLGVTIDQALIFHDPATLSTKKQMVGHNDEVIDVAFASAETIAVCTNSDHLRIFELESRGCRLFHGHTNIILAVDCNAAAGLIATSSKDQLVRVWHLATGRCVGLGEGHVDAVGAVAVAPRNSHLCASGSADRTIKLWDLAAAKKWAASPGDEDDVPKLKVMRSWAGHDKDINSVAIAPNDGMLASGSQDRLIKLWDCATGELRQVCKGHKRGVWCVKFSPVDKVVASASADATIKLWSIADGTCLKTFEGHEGSVLKVAFVCSGMQVLSAGSDGLVKLWTIKTSDCVDTFDHHTDKVPPCLKCPGSILMCRAGPWKDVRTIYSCASNERS
jgi:U3 small nucleolar RNA-associated protein 13